MAATTLENNFTYTVFIDLDNTLIRKVSGRELAVNAARKGLLKISSVPGVLFSYIQYKLGIKGPVEMSEKLAGWTKGMPHEKFDRLCQDTIEKILLEHIDNEIIAEIGHHEMNKARVVVLSASAFEICSRIVSYFGFDDAICTVLECRDGKLSGKASGNFCFGEEKIKRLRDFCSSNNIKISESWYYGDSLSDLPVFEEIGHPVCVNPNRSLSHLAIRNNWKILKTGH